MDATGGACRQCGSSPDHLADRRAGGTFARRLMVLSAAVGYGRYGSVASRIDMNGGLEP
jgi:hypothetical protein